MKSYIVLLGFMVICSTCIRAQLQDSILLIKLEEVPVDSAVALSTDILTRVIDTEHIKNVPEAKHLSSLRFLVLDDPDWLENYKIGDATKGGWFTYRSEGINEERERVSVPLPIEASKFAVFVTLDTTSNLKYFIIDKNNNLDFSDDILMVASMDSNHRYSPYALTISHQRKYKSGEVKRDEIPIKIHPSPSVDFKNDPMAKRVGIAVSYDRGLKGNYRDVYSYVFTTSIPFFGLRQGPQGKIRIVVETYNNNGQLIDKQWSFVGDSVSLNNSLFRMKRLNWETRNIELEFIQPAEYGFSVGNTIKQFGDIDFVSGKKVDFSFDDNEYLLLDFWGSWCHPCIQAIPKLKSLIDENNLKVKAISVAYDEKQDITALKKIISKQKMDWSHVWVDRAESNKKSIINVSFGCSVLVINMCR